MARRAIQPAHHELERERLAADLRREPLAAQAGALAHERAAQRDRRAAFGPQLRLVEPDAARERERRRGERHTRERRAAAEPERRQARHERRERGERDARRIEARQQRAVAADSERALRADVGEPDPHLLGFDAPVGAGGDAAFGAGGRARRLAHDAAPVHQLGAGGVDREAARRPRELPAQLGLQRHRTVDGSLADLERGVVDAHVELGGVGRARRAAQRERAVDPADEPRVVSEIGREQLGRDPLEAQRERERAVGAQRAFGAQDALAHLCGAAHVERRAPARSGARLHLLERELPSGAERAVFDHDAHVLEIHAAHREVEPGATVGLPLGLGPARRTRSRVGSGRGVALHLPRPEQPVRAAHDAQHAALDRHAVHHHRAGEEGQQSHLQVGAPHGEPGAVAEPRLAHPHAGREHAHRQLAPARLLPGGVAHRRAQPHLEAGTSHVARQPPRDRSQRRGRQQHEGEGDARQRAHATRPAAGAAAAHGRRPGWPCPSCAS